MIKCSAYCHINENFGNVCIHANTIWKAQFLGLKPNVQQHLFNYKRNKTCLEQNHWLQNLEATLLSSSCVEMNIESLRHCNKSCCWKQQYLEQLATTTKLFFSYSFDRLKNQGFTNAQYTDILQNLQKASQADHAFCCIGDRRQLRTLGVFMLCEHAGCRLIIDATRTVESSHTELWSMRVHYMCHDIEILLYLGKNTKTCHGYLARKKKTFFSFASHVRLCFFCN